jgi:hypothetical protein
MIKGNLMEYKQKRLSAEHTFNFQDQKLNFAFKDKSGSSDFDIYYADIPFKTSISVERNEWLRNAGYIWVFIGVVQMALSNFSNGFWFFIGLCCLIAFHFTKIKHTVFKTNEGNIFVMQIKQHDEIMNEINDRRKKQFLTWYGEINLDNEPEKEIGKFRWLQEIGIMTKEEVETKIAEIQFANEQELLLENKH